MQTSIPVVVEMGASLLWVKTASTTMMTTARTSTVPESTNHRLATSDLTAATLAGTPSSAVLSTNLVHTQVATTMMTTATGRHIETEMSVAMIGTVIGDVRGHQCLEVVIAGCRPYLPNPRPLYRIGLPLGSLSTTTNKVQEEEILVEEVGATVNSVVAEVMRTRTNNLVVDERAMVRKVRHSNLCLVLEKRRGRSSKLERLLGLPGLVMMEQLFAEKWLPKQLAGGTNM